MSGHDMTESQLARAWAPKGAAPTPAEHVGDDGRPLAAVAVNKLPGELHPGDIITFMGGFSGVFEYAIAGPVPDTVRIFYVNTEGSRRSRAVDHDEVLDVLEPRGR